MTWPISMGHSRNAIQLPPLWPALPEPQASTRCDLCSWAWRYGAMRVKVVNVACATHGRFLEYARHAG